MRQCRAWAGMGFAVWTLAAQPPLNAPDALLGRIKDRMRENLVRVPDFVCLQSIDRDSRSSPTADWRRRDTLRIQVGFVGGKEIFAWQGANRFEEKELAEMVGAGTVGTGSFAVHATNIFLSGAAEISAKGEESLEGRHALRFDYSVPEELSRYKVRVSPYQAAVAYHGSFWVDAGTLDLLRLEVHAEDIPPELGLSGTSDVMVYGRARIGGSEFLLPQASEFLTVGAHGVENRNRTQLSGCRMYASESSLRFDDTPVRAAQSQTPGPALPPGLLLWLELESELDPATAALGNPVRAVVARPLLDGSRVLVPQGAVAHARLVRLERESVPVAHYVVSLEIEALEWKGGRMELAASMVEAGPASGLIREAKQLAPTFTRSRSRRLNILVGERRRGQGVFLWKASERRIPRGFRMRWRTEALE